MITAVNPISDKVHVIEMDLAGLLVNVESVTRYMSMCNLSPSDGTEFSVPQCCNPDCDKYGKYHNMEYGTILSVTNRDCGFVCDQCRPHKAILWAQRYQMNLQGTWPPPIKTKPQSHYRQLLKVVKQKPELLKELGRIIQSEDYRGKRIQERFYQLLRSQGNPVVGEAKDDEFYDFTRALGIKLAKRELPEACQPDRPRLSVGEIEYWKKCLTGQNNILQFLQREDAKLNGSYPEIKNCIKQQKTMIDLSDEAITAFLK